LKIGGDSLTNDQSSLTFNKQGTTSCTRH